MVLLAVHATQAMGQSPDRLTQMEDAVFAAALATPRSPEEMARALAPALGTQEIRDTSELAFENEAGLTFEGWNLTIQEDLPYRHHDVTCTTVPVETARQVWDLDDPFGEGSPYPPALNALVFGTQETIDSPDLQYVTSCVGALHLGRVEPDVDAINAWYDRLNERIDAIGLDSVRESPETEGLPAGILQGRGRICDDTTCILIVAPWAMLWDDGTSGQVSLDVLTVQIAPRR
ncbi:hypothetical protein [Jannaschia aquimarina]|nr:hypothetical protein [Jannaschia aquimarina]